MRVASKVALGSGLTAALLVGVLVYDLALVEELAQDNRELSEITFQASMIPVELSRLLNEIEEFTRKHRVTGDPDYAAGVDERQREFEAGLVELGSLNLTTRERLAVGRLDSSWRTYSRRSLAAMDPGSAGRRSPESADAKTLESLERVRARILVVAEEARTAVAVKVAETAAAADRARRVSWLGALLAAGLGLMVLGITVRSIHRPLKTLVAGTEEVAAGNFGYRLERSGSDEFAGLAASFNEMVRRLGELDGMKEGFLAHVSHELKTPLVAMQETNKLLLESLPGPLTEKQRRLIELNLDGGRRLSALITRILDLARMQAGVMEYDVGRNDLVAIVRTAVAELTAGAGRDRGLRIEVVSEEATAPALCDRDRVIQVVENLLDNALKNSPEMGVVSVRIRRETTGTAPRRLVVEVADRGPGVPESERQLIFDKFHQSVDARSSNALRGVGLGLAISREIVESHQGTIEVRDNPGGGSVFRFTVPAAESIDEPVVEEATKRKTALGSLLIIAVLVLSAACTSVGGVGDMYYDSGRYQEAVAAYESFLASDSEDLERRNRTLYRLGLCYAVAGTPVYDPARSTAFLERLLEADPEGPYSVEARVLRDLQTETFERRTQAATLRAAIAVLDEELDALEADLVATRGAAGESERAVSELERKIHELNGEVARLSVDLEDTVEELERLKAIDLGPAAPGRSPR